MGDAFQMGDSASKWAALAPNGRRWGPKWTTQPAKWERVMRVPMRFNRLVLFSPWQFHTSAPGFGTDDENARLVMLLFFGRAAG